MGGFANAILGGAEKLIRRAIASPNYAAGSTGWSINKDGSAEFNSVTVRGTLEARKGNAFIGLDPAEPRLAWNPNTTLYIDGYLNFIDQAGAGVETVLSGGRLSTQGSPSLHFFSNSLVNGTAKLQAGRFELTGDLIFLNDRIGGTRYVEKSAAQNFTSTVLANVTDLSFSVEANARYEIRLRVAYDGPTATDIQMAWTVPSLALMDRCILAPQLGTADNQNTTLISIRRSAGTAQQAGTPAGVANAFSVWWEDVILETGANFGTVQLQAARVGTSGTLTVQSRSWISVTRLADP